LLLEQGDGAAAEQKYRQALAVDSRQAQAYAGLGRLLRVRDQYALALQQIDAAIAIEPNNAQWYILRGSTCFDARQFQAGVEAYEHALQIEEKSVSPAVDVRHIQAQIHLGRAMMFGGNSEPGPAEAELREAVGLEPANSLLTVQLARLLVGQKRHDDALQVIEACLQQPALRSVERAPLQQLLESLRRERGRAAPPDTSAAGPRRR